jgi:hypothetical protein
MNRRNQPEQDRRNGNPTPLGASLLGLLEPVQESGAPIGERGCATSLAQPSSPTPRQPAPQSLHQLSCTSSDTAGEGTDRRGPQAQLLTFLRTRPAGARVYELAAELATSASLVERLLRHLRDRGLVSAAQEGTPPVVTWRATP